jgi:hypothetical protein
MQLSPRVIKSLKPKINKLEKEERQSREMMIEIRKKMVAIIYNSFVESQLISMANDERFQEEMKKINEEFECTLLDGLNGL